MRIHGTINQFGNVLYHHIVHNFQLFRVEIFLKLKSQANELDSEEEHISSDSFFFQICFIYLSIKIFTGKNYAYHSKFNIFDFELFAKKIGKVCSTQRTILKILIGIWMVFIFSLIHKDIIILDCNKYKNLWQLTKYDKNHLLYHKLFTSQSQITCQYT